VLLVAAAGVIFSHGPFHAGWVFGPFAFLALAGLVVWWLLAADHPRGGGRNVARSLARVLGMLTICLALAIGGAWLAGAGGGTAAAIAVIVAGGVLAAAAFRGHGRWLILPALSLALPVAFVSAANIDLHGGAGEKEYTPGSAAQVRDTYRLGAGRLIVDLRDAKLPPGDRPLKLKLGVGEAVLVVPDNVCVATKAKVGMGVVESFDHSNGGVDVDWSDEPSAPAGNARLVLDADVGLGRLAIGHTVAAAEGDRGPHFHRDSLSDETNTGCGVTGAAG
jgi:Cell wall-active antibiotics response 4TMS YvqF